VATVVTIISPPPNKKKRKEYRNSPRSQADHHVEREGKRRFSSFEGEGRIGMMYRFIRSSNATTS